MTDSFFSPQIWLVFGVALFAGVWDLIFQRIPNWLTYPGTAGGLCLGLWPGVEPLPMPMLGGLLVGFVVPLVLFLGGGLGGGDVKLLTAAGALLGFPLIVDVMLITIIGGFLMALVTLCIRGRLGELLNALRWSLLSILYQGVRPAEPGVGLRIPLGVAIAAAMLITALRADLRITPLLGLG